MSNEITAKICPPPPTLSPPSKCSHEERDLQACTCLCVKPVASSQLTWYSRTLITVGCTHTHRTHPIMMCPPPSHNFMTEHTLTIYIKIHHHNLPNFAIIHSLSQYCNIHHYAVPALSTHTPSQHTDGENAPNITTPQ